jgi:VanZ family protein
MRHRKNTSRNALSRLKTGVPTLMSPPLPMNDYDLNFPLYRSRRLDGTNPRKWPQILLAGYWLSLLTATHWPKLPGIDVPGKDKTLHVVAFAILTGLLLNVLARRAAATRGMVTVLAAVAIVAFYGMLDEWTQPYTGRTCDIFDWLADMAGAISVALIYLAVTALKPARN